MKLVTQKELDEKLFKKPGFKEAYDELEWEYKIIDALIVARTKKGMTQAKLAGMVGTKQSAIAVRIRKRESYYRFHQEAFRCIRSETSYHCAIISKK
jgi:ribosome-binding protein aMBF1 (putative translation factor)